MTGVLSHGHAVDHVRRPSKCVGNRKQQLPVLKPQIKIDKALALGGGARRGNGVFQGIRKHAEQVDIGHMHALGHGGAQVGGNAALADIRAKRRKRDVYGLVGAEAAYGGAVAGFAEFVDAFERLVGVALLNQSGQTA